MLGSSHSLLVLLLSPNALEDICRSWYQLVAIGYLSLYKHFGFLSLMHPRVWAESGFADLITVAHPSAIFRELAICLRNRLLASQNLNQHIRKRSAICISTVSVGQTYVFSIFLTNSIPFKERAVMLHKHILCCSSVPKEWNSIHFFIYRDQVNKIVSLYIKVNRVIVLALEEKTTTIFWVWASKSDKEELRVRWSSIATAWEVRERRR